MPTHGVDLIVLAGVSGRTLAFGPGHAPGSARPGTSGTTIITGHRDTHFRFLAALSPEDEILVEKAGGERWRYRVRKAAVVDSRRAAIRSAAGEPGLVLVTCYPFDAVAPGGPLRYVVVAELRQPHGAPRPDDVGLEHPVRLVGDVTRILGEPEQGPDLVEAFEQLAPLRGLLRRGGALHGYVP